METVFNNCNIVPGYLIKLLYYYIINIEILGPGQNWPKPLFEKMKYEHCVTLQGREAKKERR